MDDKPLMSRNMCAYCGLAPWVEKEHVIARCIIPPPRKHMITVPACGACNDQKKHDDEQLRDMLIMDIENEGHPLIDEEARGRLTRSIDRKQSGFVKGAKGKSVYEERITESGKSLGFANRAHTDDDTINRIFSWIVRGLLFDATGDRLPADCIFTAGKVDIEGREASIAKVKAKGGKIGPAIPPAFESHFMRAQPDPTLTWWILRFFNVHVWVSTNFEKYSRHRS